MALLDCELLGRSVGLAGSDVIFKSRTLDYITHTYDGEKKLRRHIQLHIGAYPFFAVFVMRVAQYYATVFSHFLPLTPDLARQRSTSHRCQFRDRNCCYVMRFCADSESCYCTTQRTLSAGIFVTKRFKLPCINVMFQLHSRTGNPANPARIDHAETAVLRIVNISPTMEYLSGRMSLCPFFMVTGLMH
jgi:hypothetical protein